MIKVMIMAGGTGGHVFPALAVAAELRERGADVFWLGTRQGLEAKLVPEAEISMEWVSVSGLRGKGFLVWLLAPWRLLWAALQVLSVILRQRPVVVLGMGGFVTGPGGVVTWLLRKPLVIHEQNAIAGLTNRLLAQLAQRVCEAFPDTFHGKYVTHTGNPVRRAISALPVPEDRFNGRQGALRLLVMGGSLGARVLNEVVPAAIACLSSRPEVWHQAGIRNIDDAVDHYRNANVTARVEPFIDDMAAAYEWADLVVCRAGALTIAELAAAGVGAILVPYPHAVDDHQTQNAAYLTNAGAALVIQQREFTREKLHALLVSLTDRSRLLHMAQAARRLAMPHAAATVASMCWEAANG